MSFSQQIKEPKERIDHYIAEDSVQIGTNILSTLGEQHGKFLSLFLS